MKLLQELVENEWEDVFNSVISSKENLMLQLIF